ncbi:hypothetical protein C8Q78DRAFT_1082251 [Trametes maxima]|nr:hypothetical protein C8Q78DRAFT_1082251 [Trametes maxima]
MPNHDIVSPAEEVYTIALILSLGPSKNNPYRSDDNELLTLGPLPVESIPRLRPFVHSLAAFGSRHKAVVVRYTRGSNTPLLDVSHAECRLESSSQQSILQRLFHVHHLRSYDITLPTFGLNPLRKMRAGNIDEGIILRGEFPSTLQFLVALEVPALPSLELYVRRNQYEALCERNNIDPAYGLQLSSFTYASLRKVRVEEDEPYDRFSSIRLSRMLRPFFSLRQLEDVELTLTKSALAAPDHDMRLLANVWRNARRLAFSCTRYSADAPTLDTLYVLAERCPGLVELVLPKLDIQALGAFIENRPPEEPPVGLRGHPLRVFGISCDSHTSIPKEQAVRIARCIDSLFPNIDVEKSWVHDGSLEAILSDWYLIWVNITATKALRKYTPGKAYLDKNDDQKAPNYAA